jgi:hypothetical protein
MAWHATKAPARTELGHSLDAVVNRVFNLLKSEGADRFPALSVALRRRGVRKFGRPRTKTKAN